MINRIMNIEESNPMYNKLMNELNTATDENLVIVARNAINRKDSRIKPIAVKNGIYFYVAYDLDGKTAYLGEVTPEQVYKAKANMVRRVRIGSMIDIVLSNGKALDKFQVSNDPMNIVTLDCRMFGGGLLLCDYFLREMEKKIGQYYIIPSSIHELILVPAEVMLKNDLTEMVKDINKNMVNENEILADRAFEVNEWM